MSPMKMLCALLAAACFAAPAQAQQSAKILSGFQPGGAVDILARVFAEKWSEAIGRPVVVETRSGAAGIIAMEALKVAPPDGNTLVLTPDSNFVVYPHTVAKPVYNSLADFVPIALTGTTSIAFGVSSRVPAKTLAEFIVYAKANPKEASFGSSGAGSSLQFFGEMIGRTIGAPLTHVPYRGVGPTITDLVAGQLTAAVLPLGTVLTQVKAGKAMVLAHSGAKRAAAAPDIPTFKELGYPALEAVSWFGIFGPAGMKPDAVARLNEIFLNAMRNPAIRDRMEKLDLEIEELTPAQFAARIKAGYDQWEKVVKSSGWDKSQH